MFSTLVQRKEDFVGSMVMETSKGQVFLDNDPLFNIHLDLFPYWDNEESVVKKRRLQIQRLDEEMFQDTYDEDDFMFTNIMDQEVNTSHNYFEVTNNEVDFEFDKEGAVVTAEPVPEQEPFIFEMDDLNNFPHEEVTNVEVTKNITNDPNFHISTTENIITVNEKVPRKRKYNLVVDTCLQLTKQQILENGSYMEPKHQKVDLYKQLLLEYDCEAVNYIRHINMSVLGRIIPEFRSQPLILHNVSKEIQYMQAIDRMEIPEEYELAREIRPSLHNNYEDFDIEGDIPLDDNFETPDSILNLSFGGLDQSLNSEPSGTLSRGTQVSYEDEHDDKISKFFRFVKSTVEASGDRQNINGEDLYKIRFSQLIPNRTGEAIGRRLAANSFASILALTTLDMMKLGTVTDPTQLSNGTNIVMYVPVRNLLI